MFALAVLFVAMDETIAMPQEIRIRIMTAYAALHLDKTHPVLKVPIHVYRIEELLMIDEAVPLLENTGGNGAGGNEVASRIPIQTMLVRMDRMERNTTDLYRQHEASIQRLERVLLTHFNTMNNNIRRFGGTIEGAFVIQQGGNRTNRKQAPSTAKCHPTTAGFPLSHTTILDGTLA
jgi:hypothetical protein